MIHKIFSIRDSAMDTFNRPFTFPTAAAAVRSFSDEVNRQSAENEMNRHPHDYSLHELGQFDDQSGELIPHKSPQQILRAQDAITKVTTPQSTS